MLFNKKKTQEKRVPPPLKTVNAAEIIKAGGLAQYAKKVGYKSVTDKIAGAIPMTDEEFEAIQKQLDRD